MRLKKYLIIAAFFAVFLFVFTSEATAQSVTIDPKRVVFEGRLRVQEVQLVNRGNKDASYRIFFQETLMNEDGKINVLKPEEISDAHTSVSKMVRYSPRRVTVPARGGQVVKILLRKPGNITDGEYRSNLVFQGIPDVEKGDTLENVARKDNEVSISITPIFGISIPVIVRHGQMSANGSISDVGLEYREGKEGQEKYITLTLNREGNRSLYGHFTVTYQDAWVQEETVVARVKGVAAYPETNSRKVSIKINEPDGLQMRKDGILKITYEEDKSMGGDLLLENILTLK